MYVNAAALSFNIIFFNGKMNPVDILRVKSKNAEEKQVTTHP